jgi:hypothetical protein
MAQNRDICIESALPVVSSNGLNTNANMDLDSGSNTCALPASTTVGGSPISALGNITGSNTTGATFSVTNSGIYTGVGSFQNIANSATTGVAALMTANGLTTGTVLSLTSTGTIVTTGEVLNIAANSATTSTGLLRVSGTGLTDGFAAEFTSGGANTTASGGGVNIALGAATVGTGLKVLTSGVYTGTTGVLLVSAASATTGSIGVITGTGVTSGKILTLNATAATLTTGRYVSMNDAAGEVFGIGANGHIHSTVGATAPTIVVTTQAGITAAAITAGGSDVCGVITTTGTSTGATQLTVTFNKTYTTAPKTVMIAPANAAAAMPNTGYFVDAITATTFRITVAAGGTYAATPSWYYQVIA